MSRVHENGHDVIWCITCTARHEMGDGSESDVERNENGMGDESEGTRNVTTM